MKTKMYFLSICVLILSVSASARMKEGQIIRGDSQTEFGSFTIAKSQTPMVFENQALTSYVLMYENASSPLQIGVIKEKKCTTFLVRSAEFEAMYRCRKNVFGVVRPDKKYCQLTDEAFNTKLDKVNFYAQRVITQKPKTEEELLGLIACYFPNLVNKQYHAQF